MTSRATIVKGLGSALLLAAVVVGVPAVLLGIGAFPSSVPDLQSLWRAATGPDTSNRAVFAVLAALAWLSWASFTTSVLREIAAAIRSRGARPARPLPGLSWSAHPAALLVAAVVAMFVAAPLLTATAPPAAAAGHAPTGAGQAHRPTAAAAPHPGAVDRAGATTAADVIAHSDTSSAAQPRPVAPADHQPDGAKASAAGHTRYTVKRHDTLWSIAERHLGDPLRYREIAALNPHLGPDYLIRAGQILTLPANGRAMSGSAAAHIPAVGDAAGHPATHVTVAKGDTLSGIAAEHGIRNWHTVWAANAGKPQPGGKQLTDPDHIEVGWDITVPATATPPSDNGTPDPPAAASSTAPSPDPTPATAPPPAPRAPQAAAAAPDGRHGPPELEQPSAALPQPGTTVAPTPAAGASPAPAAAGTGTPPPAPTLDRQDPASPSAANEQPAPTVVGFAAGGAVLAAGVFTALALARRQQFRDRRPGRTIASTGPALVPIERATVTVGGPAAGDVTRLDQVLRRLAATDIETLHVAAVQLTGKDITVHLARPAALADPWQPGDGAGLVWTFPSVAETAAAGPDPDDVGAIAPYPTLVTIGSDKTSSWLLNLEQAGTLVLTGDPGRCLQLARVMAAQLGLNPWADALSVTLLGFGQELLDAAPARLRYAPSEAAAAVLSAALTQAVRTADFADQHRVDVVEGRRHAVADETWAPQVLLIAGDAARGDDASSTALAGLVELVQARAGATGTAAVVIAAEADPGAAAGAAVAHLNTDGILTLPDAGLTVVAAGWDKDTARGVGMLLAHARTAPDEKVPDATGPQAWKAFSDTAGALRAELVQPRNAPVTHRTDEASRCTLPLADEVYLEAAATTAEDLQALAPRVPAQVRTKLERADPTLDDDVAAWLDESSPRAKLSLLGPLTLRSSRPAPERLAFYAELTAYLATREHGATADQVATAFNLAAGSARRYLGTVRDMLGDNPDTGQPYLPHADKSTAAKTRGVNVYEITGLLIDADLFRRLRLRGQARGENGLDDYVTALRLVTGEPFSQLREGGGAWLVGGDRLDLHLTHAIVDVAHTVTTHALAAGDPASARAAVDIARLAAPYEETPRLDAAAVAAAEGRTNDLRRTVADEICNRSDDGQPPAELNERTKQILAHHRDWLSRAS